MAASGLVESNGLIVLPAEAGACQGLEGAALQPMELSGLLKSPGGLPVSGWFLRLGLRWPRCYKLAEPSSNMVVVEAHLLQGPVKFPPHPWLPFGPSRFFLPHHECKNGPIWGGLGLFPAKSLCTGTGVSGLSRNYSIDCLYEI